LSDWFEAGLPFRCTGCGDCCTGAPGAVWVNDDEVAALAAHFGVTAAEFEREHVRLLGGRRSLMERFDGDCEFFDQATRGCTVYEARPTQCRTFPFWAHNVASPDAWQGVCDECEGARLTEPLVSADAIRAHAAETRRARERG
jgi:uncharacterized protein